MEGWKGLQPRLRLFAEEGKQEAKGVKRHLLVVMCYTDFLSTTDGLYHPLVPHFQPVLAEVASTWTGKVQVLQRGRTSLQLQKRIPVVVC